jgi:flagellar basal body-associated protein FliL
MASAGFLGLPGRAWIGIIIAIIIVVIIMGVAIPMVMGTSKQSYDAESLPERGSAITYRQPSVLKDVIRKAFPPYY